MCLLNLLGGKFNDRAEITIGLTCVVCELLLVVGCTALCVAAGITMVLTLVLDELLLLLLLFAPSDAELTPSEMVLCVVAVLGRYRRGVIALTIGVVEVVAVVVHVVKCLAVVAVPPSVRVHQVELVETAGV